MQKGTEMKEMFQDKDVIYIYQNQIDSRRRNEIKNEFSMLVRKQLKRSAMLDE